MKNKLTIFALILSCFLSVLAAYGYGYYRGYTERSRVLTAVNLTLNEAVYDGLQRNNAESTRENLKVVIYSESESLRSLEKKPFKFFADEFSSSSAGDISKELQKADRITEGMTFTPLPGLETK